MQAPPTYRDLVRALIEAEGCFREAAVSGKPVSGTVRFQMITAANRLRYMINLAADSQAPDADSATATHTIVARRIRSIASSIAATWHPAEVKQAPADPNGQPPA